MSEATLYEHEDDGYAVAPGTESPAFTHGDPKWHRVGPVDVSTLSHPATTDAGAGMAMSDEQVERMTEYAFASTNDLGEIGLQKYWYGKGVRNGFALAATQPNAACDESNRRIYDLLLGDDGQAWKEARKYLERVAPELAERLPLRERAEQEAPELLLGWRRYEKARKLSPLQWNRLHTRNLAGENFDAMIDALPEPSTPVPASHPEAPAAPRAEPAAASEPVAKSFDAFLCRAWGETDLAVAELVTDWNGVRRFLIREWLGREDEETLLQVKDDFAQHEEEHNGRGGAHEIIFEIGGVSIERVCGFAALNALQPSKVGGEGEEKATGVAGDWYCEAHPEHLMGHDGCTGAGIIESARIPMFVALLKSARQHTREAEQFRDDVVAQVRNGKKGGV